MSQTGFRLIPAGKISKAVTQAIGEIYCSIDPEVREALEQAYQIEDEPLARDMLAAILENARLGPKDKVPVCQDTGTVVVIAELGCRAKIGDGGLKAALAAGIDEAWRKFYLRGSVVQDPLFARAVPATQVPFVLHLEQTRGDRLSLSLALKGGGAENTSALRMFNPTAGVDEVGEFVVQTVVAAGGKPCPPLIVGVGIGGNFESCAILAKKALLSPLNQVAEDARYRELSLAILKQINARGKGIQGMGGKTTALAVKILAAPCHIASLPVAVNIECHAHRWTRLEL